MGVENNKLICGREQGFTMGNCTWQIWQPSTIYKVTALIDMWRATDIIYLNLCKGYDTVLVSKMERHRPNRWNTQWIRNCLDSWTQKIVINASMFRWSLATSRVPQGSVLSPVLSKIFVSIMDNDIGCAFSESDSDTKPYGVVDPLERRHVIQKDYDRVENRASEDWSSTIRSAKSCIWGR